MNPVSLGKFVRGGLVLAVGFSLSVASLSAQVPKPVGLRLVAEGYVSPINLIPFEDGSGRVLIGDQIGVVKLLSKEGPAKVFLDLRPKITKLKNGFDERGLLGIALHPKFNDSGKFYIYYSAPLRAGGPEKWDHTSHLSEFRTLPNDRSQADPAYEKLLLQIDQPQANHNSGRMAFGPDGLLYFGVGDGGGGNDVGLGHAPQGNGQDLTTHLGKILRIDVNSGNPYSVPKDNPFVGNSKARPEIYAFGLRNPWGLSFDRGGQRELLVADVGQNRFEEVNIIVKGGNYGWNLREGFQGFDPKAPLKQPETMAEKDAEERPFVDPAIVYKNAKGFPKDADAGGTSITGGYVYRGKAIPHLVGKYVFADWSRIWTKSDGAVYVATRPEAGANKPWKIELLPLASHPDGQLNKCVVALGESADGELYVMTNDGRGLEGETGKVFKLVPQ